MVALSVARARRDAAAANLTAEIAAWVLSVIPAAVAAGIQAGLGDSSAAAELSERVIAQAPKWEVPEEEEWG